MPRIQIKYRKGEEVKYISHRDLIRAFGRAIRRAEIPIAYSQGFNPRMKISWGQALKVGASSEGETAELQLAVPMPPDEIMTRLNRQLPKGLAVLGANLL
ncbi:MAG: TIGR03936 family radical SAM-associated protein [Candidatus Margulisbacteria bacterium]|nr:TIGR03936 family radical SAM-associated protein [Candidatus Margulisiibacteriota bacterium]MBU1617201.1 TIGR03936 family radical SAM-associated protein [Candidatus Margulisiibacteriota bacterium]